MRIHQEFHELPPKALLMPILDTKATIYIFLWEHKNDAYQCEFEWKELSKHFNKNTFRTNLRKLNDIGLISYHETDKKISIELVSWEDLNNSGDEYE